MVSSMQQTKDLKMCGAHNMKELSEGNRITKANPLSMQSNIWISGSHFTKKCYEV